MVLTFGLNIVTAMSDQRATGLSAVAGGLGTFTAILLAVTIVIVLFWIAASTVLMHLWLLLAMNFAWLQRPQLRRQEEWKLAGTAMAFVAIYSRPIAAWIIRLFWSS